MPMILPPRANTQHRLLCSECRERNGGDEGLKCFFEEYTTPADPRKVDVFELRNNAGVLESLEQGPPSPHWKPYTGGNVLCLGCLEHSKGQQYMVYDPSTRGLVGP